MRTLLAGLWLTAVIAAGAATPLWQRPHVFHSSMARNIRHLPCVSRKTGEAGTCMFAFSCAKLNGTHLGTCIDRFYFGSCCKVPEEGPGGDLDVVPPIEDNSLDSTTSRIRPAVTQKPIHSSTITTANTGVETSLSESSRPSPTPGPSSPSSSRPSSPTPSQWPSSSGPSQRPSSPGPSQRPSSPEFQTRPGAEGTHRPFAGSTERPITGSVGISSTQVTPEYRPSTSSTQGPTPAFQLPTTAPPTLVTWTTIEEGSGKPPPPPPPVSIRPQVSEVSGGTHRPTLSSTPSPSSTGAGDTPSSVVPISTTGGPTSARPPPSTSHLPITSPQQTRPPVSTHRPITSSTVHQVPVSMITPPSSTVSRPSLVTAKPKPTIVTSSRPQVSSNTTKPQPGKPPVTKPTKPPSGGTKPPTGGAKPPSGGTKPPPSGTKPPSKPPSKPTPSKKPARPGGSTARPKPPSKPQQKPTTRPPPTATARPPPPSSTASTPASSSTTTQPSSSQTWVPVSVSTHEPVTTTRPTTGPSKEPTPSSTAGGVTLPTGSVAMASVMPTTSPGPTISTSTIPSILQSLNMTNYREVCGRRLFPESRVVGGDKSTFGKWPWQISLRQWRTSTYLHKCGAALLNENWAITAAHCVENVPPSDLLLRLGEHDLSIEDEPFGYQERRVQIVASHPQFDPRTFEYDLALLRFYEPVVFQPNILPICVPEDDTNFVGTTAYVTGWGRLYEDGPLPSVLQEVSVPVINNTLCETMYRAAGYIEHIPDIFICAGWKKGGFDSCEGDSGGPMVIQRPDKRWLLAGVISWGIGCAEPNQPGVYTRISQFRHWINQILQF